MCIVDVSLVLLVVACEPVGMYLLTQSFVALQQWVGLALLVHTVSVFPAGRHLQQEFITLQLHKINSIKTNILCSLTVTMQTSVPDKVKHNYKLAFHGILDIFCIQEILFLLCQHEGGGHTHTSQGHSPSLRTTCHGNALHICWQCTQVFQEGRYWKEKR